MNDERARLQAFQQDLGLWFRRPELLQAALTHASYCNEARDPTPDNERLEFLGDAILNTVIAAAAFQRFPTAREGDLTRMKALVVSEPSLATQARVLRLGDFLRLGKGAATGDRVSDMPSVLADTFEALVGAIYLDAGFEAAQSFVLAQLGPMLNRAATEGSSTDPKSALQVRCLKESRTVPRYEIVALEGPSHAPAFTARVLLPDGTTFTGQGRCKKDAEQAAAEAALAALNRPGLDRTPPPRD